VEKVKVTAFGGFSISVGGVKMSDRSRKTRLLLEYLAVFKSRTRGELIALLWGPDRPADEFVGALNAIVHRLKQDFRAICPDNVYPALITSSKGVYALNKQADLFFDFDEFERLYKNAAAIRSDAERLMLYIRAIELYKGEFLPDCSAEKWAVPYNMRFRDLYVRSVKAAIGIMEKIGRLNEIVPLCRAAVAVEPYVGRLHAEYIRALINGGDRKGAAAHYLYAKDLLLTKLGEDLPDDISEMCEEIINASSDEIPNFDEAVESLSDTENMDGAFYCEYEVFRRAYLLEIRRSERHDRGVNVFLVTLTRDSGKMPQESALEPAMEKLFRIIAGSLRLGDIFARYSPSQYIMMLRFTNREACELILERLEKRYREEKVNGAEAIAHEFQPIYDN